MNKRRSLIITAVIIAAGIIISVMLSNQRDPVSRRSKPAAAERVSTVSSRSSDIRTTVTISGPLTALDRIDVYAEVSGILKPTGKRFKPGNSFKEGETMIQIDDSVYRNNLLAQKSTLLNQLTTLLPDLSIDFPESTGRWRSYLKDFDLHKPLPPLPEPSSEKERYYIASHNIFNLFYTIKSMEFTLAKYSITAPYDGVVTSSAINPGTLVRQGQKLGEFISTEKYEMRGAADPGQIDLIAAGLPAELTSYGLRGKFKGTISRINNVIDKNTQTVAVYIRASDSRLRDGLYMTASIESKLLRDVTVVPGKSLAGRDMVWVYSDSTLQKTKVEVVAAEEEQVIVRGLPDGTRVVTQPPGKARVGMKVVDISEKPETENSKNNEVSKDRPSKRE
ncbi:MAG: efflux RND transporter periplasmic adaptor subunit [Candidatus Krumholzibacteriota bacterium]|nr:efflux RND transporter periplasmic adaptor subunit [Candidatus Krumholzibacteriota bacterium]